MVESNLQTLGARVCFSAQVLERRKLIRESVSLLITVYRLYGFDDTGFTTSGAVRWYERLSEEYYGGDWLKLFKDKLASFFAYHIASFDNSVPELPQVKAPAEIFCPGILLGGRAYRFQRCLARNPLEFRGFITSLLYSKKGFPRPTKDYLRKGERDTFATLTTEVEAGVTDTTIDPFSEEQLKEPGKPVFVMDWSDEQKLRNPYLPATFSQSEFAVYAKRVVKEVYGGKTFLLEDRIKPIFPSTSANYNNTRSKLGTVGYILDHPDLLEGLRTDKPLITSEVKTIGNIPDVIVDDSELKARFETLYNRALSGALVEEPKAVPLALPEALKVRTITKGPPLLGFVLKPLQKFLWKTLAEHPTFRFTGKPANEEDIQKVMGKLKPGQKFLSADYSDATNSLYSWVSNIIGEALADELKLSPDERKLLIRGLTGHVIEWRDPQTKKVHLKPQVRGQLMGSVVSFPVLCLANAAICLLAYELEYGQKLTLRTLPLLINGDDALLKGSKDLQQAWMKMANFVGMKPSIGKVYFSSVYLNINSTSYIFHPEGYTGRRYRKADGSYAIVLNHYELVKYVNMGLLMGLTRSGGKTSASSVGDVYGSLGIKAHALLDLCPPDKQLAVYKAYLSRNKEMLSASRVPWFTPTHLGGLGLPAFMKFQPSNLDLRVARKIFEHPDKFPVPRPKSEIEWMTWKYALKRFDDFPRAAMAVRSLSGFGGQSTQNLLGQLAIEALFTQTKVDLAPKLALEDELDHLEHDLTEDQEQVHFSVMKKLGITTSEYSAAFAELSRRRQRILEVTGLKHPLTFIGVIGMAFHQAQSAHLNALRALNSKVLRDNTIKLPEPFRDFPSRSPDINNLEGAFRFKQSVPFANASNFFRNKFERAVNTALPEDL